MTPNSSTHNGDSPDKPIGGSLSLAFGAAAASLRNNSSRHRDTRREIEKEDPDAVEPHTVDPGVTPHPQIAEARHDDARDSTNARAPEAASPRRGRRDAPAISPRGRWRAVPVRHREDIDVLLLAAARRRPANGPELIDLVRRLSGGTFRLQARSVYRELHHLKNNRLIRISWADGTRRYLLTPLGERVLNTRRHEWAAFSNGFNKVLDMGHE
jgi:DNA-binding PadR family transcriptional regulator